jgi:hypothetical protein
MASGPYTCTRMKKINIILFVIACGLSTHTRAQSDTGDSYRNFPIVVTIQFHALTLPFHDMKTNFSNVGIGIGTELSLNGKQSWVQQVNAVWYRNKSIGNGIFFYTQNAWRPTVASNVFTEVKAGAGYLYAFRPVESFKLVNGNWEPVGHRGKGLFAVPVGFSVGYNSHSTRISFAPFVSYQFLVVSGYNKTIPIVPETLIQVGSRVHLN